MANFDEAIPPGGEGKIRVKFRTKGLQGGTSRVFRVYTNDPKNRVIELRIKAFVKAPIYISSRYVNIYGKEAQRISRTIEIRAELDRPLQLTPIRFNLEERLSYVIEEIEADRKFHIRFTRIPGPAEFSKGFLKLRTNYPEKRQIILRINIQIVKEKHEQE